MEITSLGELKQKQAEKLEALMAEQAGEVERFHREAELRERLPLQPHAVTYTLFKSLGIHLKFKCGKVVEAANIVRAFAPYITPVVEARDGCLKMAPVELLEGGYLRAYERGGCAESTFHFTTDQGDGYGPNLQFGFFAKLEGGDMLRIEVDLGTEWLASARLDAGCSSNIGYRAASSRPNETLNKHTHQYIRWSPNKVGRDARYTYTLKEEAPYRDTIQLLEGSDLSHWGSTTKR